MLLPAGPIKLVHSAAMESQVHSNICRLLFNLCPHIRQWVADTSLNDHHYKFKSVRMTMGASYIVYLTIRPRGRSTFKRSILSTRDILQATEGSQNRGELEYEAAKHFGISRRGEMVRAVCLDAGSLIPLSLDMR